MKGLIEQAVLVGCDIDNCPRLLIFNRGVDREDLDEAILGSGWSPIKSPAGDADFQQEHACPAHVEELGLLRPITYAEAELLEPEYIQALGRVLARLDAIEPRP